MIIGMETSSGGGGGVKVDTGVIPYATGWTGSGVSSRYKVTCGFKPKIIFWYIDNAVAQTSNMCLNDVYDESISDTYYQGSNGHTVTRRVQIGATSNPDWLNLVSVDADGFTLGYYDYRDYSSLVLSYVAIG